MRYYGTIKELIPKLLQMDLPKYYDITIKEPTSKRTLQQNKMLWSIIHAIAKETGQNDNEVYCAMLEKADALSDYIITATEMEQALRKSFRGVKFVRMQVVNNKDCYIYKVYLGSSKMTTKEFGELLDITIQTACEFGIDVGGIYDE